ncbi:MAG: ribosome maturation factor RimM [Deltaproteobacteria bacterium]|nr:ribosome maturation factor RimM [Deltaproteobacteria bacterium]
MRGTSQDRVILGTLGRPHGLKGELRFFPGHPESELLESLEVVHLGERGERGVLGARPAGRFWILELEGVRDRDAAEALKGVEVWVPRDTLPEPEEGETYLTDLIGCEVCSQEGERLGRITGLEVGGSQAFLTVEASGGDWLLPAVEAFLVELDEASRILTVSLPEGLVESQRE